MIGKLIVDNVDVYSTFGIYIAQGGYESLVSAPSLKAIDTNDWPDQDGIEPDLSEPALDSKEFSISFFGGDVEGFVALLCQGAYHTFNFAEIGLTCSLRLISNESYSDIQGLRSFSLRLADDFPLNGYSYSAPNKSAITGYSVDNIDLGNYGIIVLDATELNKKAPIKKNLVVSLSNKAGVNYDGYAVYRASMDVSIKCFMRCSIADFWNNYNALLYNLTTPNIRVLRGEGKALNCYYKGIEVSEFVPISSGVWCEFDLQLTLTMKELYIMKLLATETSKVVLTEDNKIVKLN